MNFGQGIKLESMMKREFKEWLSQFKSSICNYEYYVDFNKVYKNVNEIRVELNILNSLIGSNNIEKDFSDLVKEYPKVLKCIPTLLAVRSREIFVIDIDGEHTFFFNDKISGIEEYIVFMQKSGLFELISNRIINNLYDYVTGVEVGLDSNGRKNRGGHIMENLVENFIKKAGFEYGIDYFKEMRIGDIEKRWNIDLSLLSNKGRTVKRFDFVVKTDKTIFAIETNFYSSGGSKLNETARSYKSLALESKKINGFAFVWITDGFNGWKSARHNLEETFEIMDNIYCLADLENDIMSKILL